MNGFLHKQFFVYWIMYESVWQFLILADGADSSCDSDSQY